MNTGIFRNGLLYSIITLFIVSAVSPIVFGYYVSTSNEMDLQSPASRDGGLMDSAWPMFHHDIRHTGSSPYGNFGNWFVEKWKVDIGSLVYSSPAIDKDGIIYIGSNDWNLYAINSNGTEKWRFKTGGGVSSSPAIAEDGTIYVGSENGKLYAIDPNGIEKWSTRIGSSWVYSSPVIDDDGIIYVGSVGSVNGNICAVYPNGTKKWDTTLGGMVFSSPVLDNDGSVYCGSYDHYFYALYKNNGTLKWKFNTEDWLGNGAAISKYGIIYFGNKAGNLFAFYPNGTKKWQINNLGYIKGIPAIAEDGSVIVGTGLGRVYSITPDGNENWMYSAQPEISASPVIDKYGIIYIGTFEGIFYALNPDGTLRWKYKTLDSIFPSAAIGESGVIYFGAHSDTFQAYLYAIQPIQNQPPNKPTINGPAKGQARVEYTYNTITADPDGDNISYLFDWGDGTNSGWTEYVPTNTQVSRTHSWKKVGTYIMKVKAKDDYGMESNWESFVVSMPKNKNLKFIDILENHPLLYNFLKVLLKL